MKYYSKEEVVWCSAEASFFVPVIPHNSVLESFTDISQILNHSGAGSENTSMTTSFIIWLELLQTRRDEINIFIVVSISNRISRTFQMGQYWLQNTDEIQGFACTKLLEMI